MSIAFIKYKWGVLLDIKTILIFAFFTILVSIQYSLNRILVELRDIRKNIYTDQNKIKRQED